VQLTKIYTIVLVALAFAATMMISLDTSQAAHATRVQKQINGVTQSNGHTSTDNLGVVYQGATLQVTKYRLINTGSQNVSMRYTITGGVSVAVGGVNVANNGAATTVNGLNGTQDLVFTVNTSSIGNVSGSVVADNTSGQTPDASVAPNGAINDPNETFNFSATVRAHANASFSNSSDQNTLVIDFGTVQQLTNVSFSISNLVSVAGLTGGLDLDSISGTGRTDLFTTDVTNFTNLAAGNSSQGFNAFFNPAAAEGTFSATYTINLSDQDGVGATNQTLTIILQGSSIPEPSTLALLAFALIGIVGYRRRK
jgi:hypothetical protein